jgi:hypothetical protein
MAHTSAVWGCDYANIDVMANTRLATPCISGAVVGGGLYALSFGMRGPHLVRTGGALIAGSLCSCLYILGRPLFIDSLFSSKKKVKY